MIIGQNVYLCDLKVLFEFWLFEFLNYRALGQMIEKHSRGPIFASIVIMSSQNVYLDDIKVNL